jgi:integrase
VIGRLERRYPGRRVNEYRAEDVRDFLLFDDDGRPTRRAHTTLANQLSVLRSFFEWAHEVGLHPDDVSSRFKRLITLKPKPVRKHHWLQKHEFEALFEACYADPCELLGPRDALTIALAAQCGLRIHEIWNLRWGDVNLRNGTASTLGKGEKLATGALPKNLVELLTTWRNHAAEGLGRLPTRQRWRKGRTSSRSTGVWRWYATMGSANLLRHRIDDHRRP